MDGFGVRYLSWGSIVKTADPMELPDASLLDLIFIGTSRILTC